MALPTDAQARKSIPLATGLLDYFPSALVAVAALSAKGNEQHNSGQDPHWDRASSGDEADALARHLLQRGSVDSDGMLHSAKVAWRALAMLQKELEAAGAPIAPGARNVQKAKPFPSPSDLPDSPVVAALIELHDEDAPISGLSANTGYNPVSQTTGD